MKKENNGSMAAIENETDGTSATDVKEIRPRKRKIINNHQLAVSAGIVSAAFLTWFVWRLCFNPLLDGAWHMKYNGSFYETYDTAEEASDSDEAVNEIEDGSTETSDVAERLVTFSEDITYEFLQDGVCRVSLGSMTVEGTYDYGVTEDYGRVVSANVVYEYSPIFYGIYKVKTSGNVFSGRKLELEEIPSEYETETETESNLLGTGEKISLLRGKGKLEIEPIDNPKYDQRLVGKWHDDGSDVTFEFTNDGHMIRTSSDGIIMDHLYTVTSDNTLFAKYLVDKEESYEIRYEFIDGTLYINDKEMRKL